MLCGAGAAPHLAFAGNRSQAVAHWQAVVWAVALEENQEEGRRGLSTQRTPYPAREGREGGEDRQEEGGGRRRGSQHGDLTAGWVRGAKVGKPQCRGRGLGGRRADGGWES